MAGWPGSGGHPGLHMMLQFGSTGMQAWTNECSIDDITIAIEVPAEFRDRR